MSTSFNLEQGAPVVDYYPGRSKGALSFNADKLIALMLQLVALAFYLVWLLFENERWLGWAASTFLAVGVATILSRARIISFYSIFLVCFLGVNLIAYANLMLGERMSEHEFLYLWISGTGLTLFCLSYTLFGNFANARRKEFEELASLSELSKATSGIHLLLVYMPLIAALTFLYVDVFRTGGLANLTRAVTKEDFGIFAQLGRYFIIFSLPSLFVLGVRLCQRKGLFALLNIFLLFLFMAAVFYALRTRSYLVGPFLAFGLGVIGFGISNKKSGARDRKTKVGLKYMIGGAILVLLVVSASAYLRFYRGALEQGHGQVNMAVVYEKTTSSGDLGYGYTIINVMEVFDHQQRRLNGQSYYRVLFLPIPRSLWPGKPLNTQRIVGEVIGGQNYYFTLPPGVQGDAYINFGILGVLVFLVLGGVMALIDRGPKPYFVFFAVSSFMPIYHLARGGFTNPLVLMMLSFIASILFYRFVLRGR